MGTLQLKSLLRRALKRDLMKLSQVLEWDDSVERLTKLELADQAEDDIRNLASTKVGNLWRYGGKVEYREVLDDIVEYYEIDGGSTIASMEAAIALNVIQELLDALAEKKIPTSKQLRVLADMNSGRELSLEDLRAELELEDDESFYLLHEVVSYFTLGFFRRGTDIPRARLAVAQVFGFRQKYDPGHRKSHRRGSKQRSAKNNERRVALIGRVSSGKSATINALFGTKVTKVSPVPGSTSKVKGFQLTENLILFDTPGLEDSKNPKWSSDAMEFATKADAVVFLVSSQQVTVTQSETLAELARWNVPVIVVLNKMDTIRGNRDSFADDIRRQLGCSKQSFIAGSINPREIDEWDSAAKVFKKIQGAISNRDHQILFNREIHELFSRGFECLESTEKKLTRKQIHAVMKRIGLS